MNEDSRPVVEQVSPRPQQRMFDFDATSSDGEDRVYAELDVEEREFFIARMRESLAQAGQACLRHAGAMRGLRTVAWGDRGARWPEHRTLRPMRAGAVQRAEGRVR